VADHHLAVPGQPAEGRVHLAERQRPATADVEVVVALEVVAVARFAFEEAEEGQGDAHADDHTPGVYTAYIHPANKTRRQTREGVRRPGKRRPAAATRPGWSGRSWPAVRRPRSTPHRSVRTPRTPGRPGTR